MILKYRSRNLSLSNILDYSALTPLLDIFSRSNRVDILLRDGELLDDLLRPLVPSVMGRKVVVLVIVDRGVLQVYGVVYC